MTTYVEYLNKSFKDYAAKQERLVVYGQNVSTGSCLSGLCRGLDKVPNCTVINTSNAENTLVGMGFGLLLRGVSSIFFMKQQDFLLLGIDQLTNTWNALRHRDLKASYTIVAIVVDSGFEGPQSCLNNLPDFSSISRIPGFTIVTPTEGEQVIGTEMSKPGVRMIGVSQRLFRTPLIEIPTNWPTADDGAIRYKNGDAATIIAFNLALPEALTLHETMSASGHSASLFSVPGTMTEDFGPIIDDLARTKRLIVLDDCKSVNTVSQKLVAKARESVDLAGIAVVNRPYSIDWSAPNQDVLCVDAGMVMKQVGLETRGST